MNTFKRLFDKFAIIFFLIWAEFFIVLILKMIINPSIQSSDNWSGELITILWIVTIIWECFLTDSKFVINHRRKALIRKHDKILKQIEKQ